MMVGSTEIAAPAALAAFFILASYLNLNDPDWIVFSTAYALGAVICGWTVLQGLLGGRGEAESDALSQRRRRYVAMTYAAACLGFAAKIVLLTPKEDPSPNSAGLVNVVLALLSNEIFREAGGVLIMAFAMAQCASIGRLPSGSSKPTMGGKSVHVASVVVAAAAILLGVLLPGYLERTGIAVPEHCGGGGE